MKKLFILLSLLFITGCSQTEEIDLTQFSEFIVPVTETTYSVEYGTEFDYKSLEFKLSMSGLNINIENKIDTMTLGEQTLSFNIDENEFEKVVTVVDTQMPVIEGKDNIEITQGDTLNLKELYSASDPIDGDLELTFTEYDLNKVGEQKITVSAKDANENEAKLELTLKVNEKAVVTNRPSGGNTSKPSGNTSKPSGNTGGNSGNTGGSSGGSDGDRYYEKATCVLDEVSFTTGEYGEKNGSGKYTCYYHEHFYWVWVSGSEAYSVETEDGGRLEGGATVSPGGAQAFSDFTLEGRRRVSNVAVKDFRDRYFPGAEITGTQH